jgi:hypothetical protein
MRCTSKFKSFRVWVHFLMVGTVKLEREVSFSIFSKGKDSKLLVPGLVVGQLYEMTRDLEM